MKHTLNFVGSEHPVWWKANARRTNSVIATIALDDRSVGYSQQVEPAILQYPRLDQQAPNYVRQSWESANYKRLNANSPMSNTFSIAPMFEMPYLTSS